MTDYRRGMLTGWAIGIVGTNLGMIIYVWWFR